MSKYINTIIFLVQWLLKNEAANIYDHVVQIVSNFNNFGLSLHSTAIFHSFTQSKSFFMHPRYAFSSLLTVDLEKIYTLHLLARRVSLSFFV